MKYLPCWQRLSKVNLNIFKEVFVQSKNLCRNIYITK